MSTIILGESAPVKDLLKLIHRVASSGSTKTNVLIIGESGTGKELVARLIHESGPLKGKPFVPVNCGAIPENLIETELFGHHKGSFTGAVADKKGLFELANSGTLFLDEVGELPLSMQVKLLRALQERKIRKVGGLDNIPVDARIIAATNRDLEAAVKQGTFREDLYYRLNVILIKTPPLRNRPGDVRILAEKFLKSFSTRAGKEISGFDAAALAVLETYSWPGNVRELENVVERAVTLEHERSVQLGSLPPAIQRAETRLSQNSNGANLAAPSLPAASFEAGGVDLPEILKNVEKYYVEAAIAHVGGVNKKAADLLGIDLRSLRNTQEKIRKRA